jgi:hypothetical protein
MGTLVTCPHCGKPIAKSLALLRLIVSMGGPEVTIDTLAATGRSPEGLFDRRLARLRKLGLIDRHTGRVWATDAGRTLVGDQSTAAEGTACKPVARH